MQDVIETNEKAYLTSEIATMLNMGVTTVRKYAQNLEREGYEFFKNKNNARLFVEKDITAIRYLKELRENTNITVEQATKMVMEKVGGGETKNISTAKAPITLEENKPNLTQEQYGEIKKLIQHQNELINGLIRRLDEEQEMMNKWLNERDKELMRNITERLEAQKLLASSEEEVKVTKRKTFFQWLFRQ